ATLFVIVMLRANGTYWLGRAARAGADRTRARALLSGKGYQRAERLVNRFGAPAVTICFVTIGVQTMINAAAGATRMSLRRYLPAVILGSVIWAMIYATVGFVTFEAFALLWQRSPVVCVVVAVVLLTLLVTYVVRAVRRARLDDMTDENLGDPAGTASTGDAHAAGRNQRSTP
ncbi:MAG: VTT domain-containing protein, partial [Propionibacteriales bacterium]|nr:VTT domain-containing protein [Propionibacteriales bacterium]